MREPLACSLTGPELTERLAEIAAAGEQAVRVGDELRFPAGAATRERLEAIVAAESRCCPFLDFELRESGADLVLTIDAPPEAEPVAAELRDAFGGREDAER
jgi:hypothetical protein